MTTKILYVLVCNPSDFYLEQAYISVFSARLHNPYLDVELLTDRTTADSFGEWGSFGELFQSLFSRIYTIDLDPAFSTLKRSRILKTGMRNYVEGDFLYVDSDTLVGPMQDRLDTLPYSLAACADTHCAFLDHPHRMATVHLCKKIGHDVSSEPFYFNGGVMLVRDTPENAQFFSLWQRVYLEGSQKGIFQDQPSLSFVNLRCGRPIAPLDGYWNCQIQHGVRFLKDAFVVHYVCTNVGTGPQDSLFLLNNRSVLQRIREKGEMTEDVQEVAKDPFKGFASLTQVFAGEDVYFFQTRRYRWLRKRFSRGRSSVLELILKCWDHLTGRV